MIPCRRLARLGAVPFLASLLLVTACREQEQAKAPVPRPVRTIVVAPSDAGETVTLTGQIDAQELLGNGLPDRRADDPALRQCR